MRLLIFLGAIAAICGCTASRAGRDAEGVKAASAMPQRPAKTNEVTRVETAAGSFLVREENREELEKLLAGEPTTRKFFAGGP